MSVTNICCMGIWMWEQRGRNTTGNAMDLEEKLSVISEGRYDRRFGVTG